MKPKKVERKKVKVVNNNQVSDESHDIEYKIYKSIIGVVILSVSILLLSSILLTSESGLFGLKARNLLRGLFGLSSFLIPIVLFYTGLIVLTKKNPDAYRTRMICVLVFLVLASCFLHLGFSSKTYNSELTFIKNVGSFYSNGTEVIHSGGIVGGLLTVPLILMFGDLGALIILLAGVFVTLIIITEAKLALIFAKMGSLMALIGRRNSKLLTEQITIAADKTVAIIKKDNKRKKRVEKEKDDFEMVNIQNSLEIHDYSETKILNESKEDKDDNFNKAEVINDKFDKKKGKSKETNAGQGEDSESKGIDLGHNLLRKLDNDYKHPSLELLKSAIETGRGGSKKELHDTAVKLEQTLANFGVNAKVINVSRGPTVTRYELSPGTGVKVSKIVGLADDLALNLAAPTVRIEAPIPGKAAVGIEIPNRELAPVYLREVIECKDFQNFSSNLAFAIGKDIAGRPVIGDIAKMPHMLIAGATGSGKSVCINTLITSILYKSSPDQVKLLMIDPKVVELGIYNGIPHLLIPVVTDPKKAAGALNWAVQEMVSRYNLFADKGVRDLKGYNSMLRQEGLDALLPQVVIIIDELADLMMVAPNDVEDAICRLAQMARAAGMHLVIATQRPSVDVITGVIKANVPSRISFAVSSQIDSRTILDMAGAEKLLGKGDMLYYPIGQPKPIRLQGALVTDKEVESLVEFIKNQAEVSYDEDIIEKLESVGEKSEVDAGDNDVLLPQAIDMVVDTGQASISIIQRRFKVGYARAARLIDQMEARGIVGGFEGSKPRKILVSKLQWEEMKKAE